MKLLTSILTFVSLFSLSTNLMAAKPNLDEKCGDKAEAATCSDHKSETGHGDHKNLSHEEKKKHHGEVLNSLFPEKRPDRATVQTPAKVQLSSPAFLASVGAQVKMEWQESFGGAEYHVQIATDPNFKWLLVNEKFHKATSYEFNAPEVGKKYYWRVAGFNRNNTASYTKGPFSSSVFVVK
jgi:hypothetical protein